MAHPHHVEEDVQRAGMQPARTEDRPPACRARRPAPAPAAPNRTRIPTVRRKECQRIAVAEDISSQHDGQEEARIAYKAEQPYDDQRHEAEVVPNARSSGPNPHMPGLRRPHE